MKFTRKRAEQCGVMLSQIVLAEKLYEEADEADPESFTSWVKEQPPEIHDLIMWMPPGSYVCGPGLRVPAPRRVGIVIGYWPSGEQVVVADLESALNAAHDPAVLMRTDSVPPKRLSLLACKPPATREAVAAALGKSL